MTSQRCSVRNCGNTVKTSRGTYTFHNQPLFKHKAAELCMKNGGILATLNTREEFEAVHRFAYECNKWCGALYYHIGLYAYENHMFYTDCTEWDWAKHGHLYMTDNLNGPCWTAVYRAYTKTQKIYSSPSCAEYKHRTICFNAFDNATTKAEGIVQGGSGISFFNVLTLLFAAVAIGFAIVSMKKNKKDEVELAEVKQQN